MRTRITDLFRIGPPIVQGGASELDTRLVMRALRKTERVLTGAGVERLIVNGRLVSTRGYRHD